MQIIQPFRSLLGDRPQHYGGGKGRERCSSYCRDAPNSALCFKKEQITFFHVTEDLIVLRKHGSQPMFSIRSQQVFQLHPVYFANHWDLVHTPSALAHSILFPGAKPDTMLEVPWIVFHSKNGTPQHIFFLKKAAGMGTWFVLRPLFEGEGEVPPPPLTTIFLEMPLKSNCLSHWGNIQDLMLSVMLKTLNCINQ